MQRLSKQRTISSTVAVEGFGYWGGRDVRLEFRPAEVNTGVVFVRNDVHPPVRIPATIENRIETPRRTSLRRAGKSVEMVEHVMAALAGLEVHNCEVWVNQAEMPGLDGSAQAIVDALDRAGVVQQNAARPQLIVREITRLGDESAWIEAAPWDGNGLAVKYRLDYGTNNAIGSQMLQLTVTPETFRRDLAPSRTFMFKEEADGLLARGLGTRATPSDLLVFDEHGPIDNELRYRDECVRHKILDLVGDLALAGCHLVGRIIAHRSGHRLNAELVRVLLAEGEVVEGWRRSA